MSETKELLQKARALLASPEAWTQGVFARLADGHSAYALDPAACAWCISGAIIKAHGSFPGPFEALYRMRKVIQASPDSLVDWNDAAGRTHAEVLAALDRAIESCP